MKNNTSKNPPDITSIQAIPIATMEILRTHATILAIRKKLPPPLNHKSTLNFLAQNLEDVMPTIKFVEAE